MGFHKERKKANTVNLTFFGKAHTSFMVTKVIMHFFFKELDGSDLPGGPVNGRMLKHYFSPD